MKLILATELIASEAFRERLEINYSAVHNSGATLRNLSMFLFQAVFIHLYELCIYMLYIFVKGMLQVI